MEENTRADGGNSGNDELMELLGAAWRALERYVARPLMALLRLLLRYWYFPVGGMALGFVIMVVWCMAFPVYKGYVMFQNNVWRSSDFVLKVRQMNLENGCEVARRMQVDPQVLASKVEVLPHFVYTPDSLHASYFVDYWDRYYEPHEERMEIMTSRFCVEIRTRDRSTLQAWPDGLVHYFETDPYINVLAEQRIENFTRRCEILEGEIQKLDSLRDLEYFKGDRRRQVVNYAVMNTQPSLYHSDLLGLQEQLEGYRSMLKYDRAPVVVVTGMQEEFLPINYWQRNIGVSLKWGLLGGVVVMLLVCYRGVIRDFVTGKRG